MKMSDTPDMDELMKQNATSNEELMNNPTITEKEDRNCLKEANEVINGDRQDSYGNPEDSFSLIAKYWDTYVSKLYGLSAIKEKVQVLKPLDIAHMMRLFKIARMQGQKPCRDNYIDCAGYSAIAADRLLKMEK